MNEKKLAAIASAYGDAWEKVKYSVTSEAWVSRIYEGLPQINRPDFEFTGEWMRPKSLSGLETNNGWVSCEDRLPEISQGIFYCLEGVPRPSTCFYDPEMPMCSLMTHWMPADAPKPPIY